MTARQVLLLIEKSDHRLSYYDVESGSRLRSVALPEFPHEFVLDPNHARAYVGHYGIPYSGSPGNGGREVLVLDVARGEVAGRMDLGIGMNRPHGIGMDGRGRLYSLSESASRIAVWDAPEFGGLPDRTASTGGSKSHLFAISSNGRRCYSMNLDSNNVTVFDPQDPLVTPVRVSTGEKPEGRLLRADEKILFVTNRISETVVALDTASLQVLATESVPGDPVRIFHDTRRGRLITINYAGKSLSLLDENTLKTLRRVELDAAPISLSFDRDMERAFLSVDANAVHVIDLDTLATVRTFATFKEPDVSAVVTLDAGAPAIANPTA